MTRRTLKEARTDIADMLGVAPVVNGRTNPKVRDAINLATEHLVEKGLWHQAISKFRFNVINGLIVCPAQIESILGVLKDNTPVPVRNSWFEFIEQGAGELSTTRGGYSIAVDAGWAPTYYDIYGNKQVRVICDVEEDAGARILLKGLDVTRNTIRTEDAGSWTDGEFVNLTIPASVSNSVFSSMSAIVKPVTNGPVRLYSYDATVRTTTSTGALSMPAVDATINMAFIDTSWMAVGDLIIIEGIGYFAVTAIVSSVVATIKNIGQADNVVAGTPIPISTDVRSGKQYLLAVLGPDETAPSYRRYLIPGMDGTSGTCTVLAKRRYQAIYNDNDDLLIPNIPAMRAMVQSLKLQKGNDFQGALVMEQQAERLLGVANRSNEGAALPVIRIQGSYNNSRNNVM